MMFLLCVRDFEVRVWNMGGRAGNPKMVQLALINANLVSTHDRLESQLGVVRG